MTDTTQPAVTQPGAIALKNSVKEAVEALDAPNSDGNVRTAIVNDLRDREIVRRTGVLATALKARDDVAKKLKGIKPTQCVGTDQATGKETFAFKRSEVEQRNKLTGALTKLDTAIDAALNSPKGETYATLEQVTAKSSK